MRRVLLTLTVTLLLPYALCAQDADRPSLHGQVVDAETGAPLAGAHVFLTRSTVGTVTDSDGRYRLDDVPSGSYEVAVSMLGYALHLETVTLPRPTAPLTVRLQPTVLALDAVTVTASRSEAWQAHLDRFKPLLLGTTRNAERCDLLNPEVLRFDAEMSGEHLRAQAKEPLIVENRALGYRIHFYMVDFQANQEEIRYKGTFRFEELEPRNRRERRRWKRRRRQAYEGSFAHFIRTLHHALDDADVREAGFDVHLVPDVTTTPAYTVSVDATQLLQPGPAPHQHHLVFQDHLQVVYRPDVPRRASAGTPGADPAPRLDAYASWLTLRHGPAAVDPAGHLFDPYAVTMHGLWSRERIAEALPRDYAPED